MAAPSPLAGNKTPIRNTPSSALTLGPLGADDSGGAEGAVEFWVALHATSTAPSAAIRMMGKRLSDLADRRVLMGGKCR